MRIIQSFSDANVLQIQIMHVINDWCHVKHTPIPHRIIVTRVTKIEDSKVNTINAAVQMLVKKGYLRRAYRCDSSSRVSYVMLRGV